MDNSIKLNLKIENKKPVELNTLTLSLNALSRQYDRYVKQEYSDYTKNERKLYVTKIESGCVFIELVPAIMPLLNDMNAIVGFGNFLKYSFEYFLGIREEKKYKYTKKDCSDLSEFLNQTAQDNGSNLKIDLTINGDNNNVVLLDSIKANAAQNKLAEEQKKLEEETPKLYIKQVMYWASASFYKNQKFNDRIIIESINEKPRKVFFSPDNLKNEIMNNDNKFNKNWQDLAYVVDVEVNRIMDTISSYKITKWYKDDTYNPIED
jgi:hypothetical protein